ncbi:MAG: EamA family transporter [Candidatus Poribacteria bacterium]
MNKRAFLLALLTAIFWGVPPLFDKMALGTISNPLLAVAIRSLAITIASFGILAGMGDMASLSNLTWENTILLLSGGMLAGLFGLWTYFEAIRYGEASSVASITAIYPAVTFILALLLLSESLSWEKILGIIFVIVGVILIER